MAAPDPIALRRHASRLVDQLDESVRDELRRTPATAVQDYFGLSVTFADTPGCGLDASFDPATRTIRISERGSASRQRFSCLHELGHYLIAVDDPVQDWLYGRGDKHEAVVEEQLADAIAAAIILPDVLVAELLPQPITVRSLVKLVAHQEYASREACCVRAAQLLQRNGMVVLSRGDEVLFSAPRNLPFRIRRGATQSDGSVFVRADRNGFATASYETVNLGTRTSSVAFDGEGIVTGDGYTLTVLTESLQEVDRAGRPRPTRWTCKRCGMDITDEPWCSACSRRECPDCGCECPPGSSAPTSPARVCSSCYLEIPAACEECPNCT